MTHVEVSPRATPFELLMVANEISGRVFTGDSLALAPTPRIEIAPELSRRSTISGRLLRDRYRLERQLGVGGYGTVFSAEDTITGARVAIKVLSPAASQSHELIIRFHREAIAASRVRHPHVVDVADFDVDVDAGHFIVMEHLDGRDLAQTLAESGPLEPARALIIAAQCARGLAAVHRVGVLHRDLKPANVFLIRRAAGGHSVKIIDFGISKLTPLAGDYTDVTSRSKVLGTPCYMSPEQARGAELDARSDIYALGVMLFEMVVGERPFTGRAPIEILSKHLSAPRVAPSTLRPELAACPGLDALVLRALAPDAASRFASMEELGDAILACLRAIDPSAVANVTDPTGEQTDRARPKLLDPPLASDTQRVVGPRRSRWLVVGAVAIAASVALLGVRSTAPTAAPGTAAVHTELSLPAPNNSTLPPVLPAVPAPPAADLATAEPAASAPRHEVAITSSPRGASVYRGGERLGVTPLVIAIEGTAAQPLTLAARGYRDRRIVVSRDRAAVDVVLQPKRAKPAATAIDRGVAEW